MFCTARINRSSLGVSMRCRSGLSRFAASSLVCPRTGNCPNLGTAKTWLSRARLADTMPQAENMTQSTTSALAARDATPSHCSTPRSAGNERAWPGVDADDADAGASGLAAALDAAGSCRRIRRRKSSSNAFMRWCWRTGDSPAAGAGTTETAATSAAAASCAALAAAPGRKRFSNFKIIVQDPNRAI